MCDGPCNRAYHESCSKPPFVAADIPDDCLWYCSACDAKVCDGMCMELFTHTSLPPSAQPMLPQSDIIDNINDVMETEYELEHSWKSILSPEADLAFEAAMAMVRLHSGEYLQLT